MTATDLVQLRADAARTQAAIAAEEEKVKAAAATAAEARREREIAWAFDRIARYPQDLATAGEQVSLAASAFDAEVMEGRALPAYLRLIKAMTAGDSIAEAMVRARNILRLSGILPTIVRTGRDPVGQFAPWPLVGASALPDFDTMVSSAVAAARSAAARTTVTDDPAAFAGSPTEALKRSVLASEWVVDQELELLLAVKVKHPTHYAERLTAEQRAQVEAYSATRAVSGHGDDPLPTPAIPTPWRQPSDRPTAREAAERWMP